MRILELLASIKIFLCLFVRNLFQTINLVNLFNIDRPELSKVTVFFCSIQTLE